MQANNSLDFKKKKKNTGRADQDSFFFVLGLEYKHELLLVILCASFKCFFFLICNTSKCHKVDFVELGWIYGYFVLKT